jgi:ketosteroid isomerase-like protein
MEGEGSVTQTLRFTLLGVLPVLFIIGCRQGGESNAGASPAIAQVGAGENVEELLAKKERDWANALVKGDIAFTEDLLADDYVGTAPDGRRLTKTQTLDEFRAGAFKSESMVVDRIKVRVFGDTAVVTLDQTEKSRYQGRDIIGRSKWTDIYMKRNGKWQLVANHGSGVDQPKK